jgi:hypothetical protein
MGTEAVRFLVVWMAANSGSRRPRTSTFEFANTGSLLSLGCCRAYRTPAGVLLPHDAAVLDRRERLRFLSRGLAIAHASAGPSVAASAGAARGRDLVGGLDTRPARRGADRLSARAARTGGVKAGLMHADFVLGNCRFVRRAGGWDPRLRRPRQVAGERCCDRVDSSLKPVVHTDDGLRLGASVDREYRCQHSDVPTRRPRSRGKWSGSDRGGSDELAACGPQIAMSAFRVNPKRKQSL